MTDPTGPFTNTTPLREKIRFVLSVMKKGSANEIGGEIAELEGIATEEGLAELIIATEQELEKLVGEGRVNVIKEHRQKKRFTLAG